MRMIKLAIAASGPRHAARASGGIMRSRIATFALAAVMTSGLIATALPTPARAATFCDRAIYNNSSRIWVMEIWKGGINKTRITLQPGKSWRGELHRDVTAIAFVYPAVAGEVVVSEGYCIRKFERPAPGSSSCKWIAMNPPCFGGQVVLNEPANGDITIIDR